MALRRTDYADQRSTVVLRQRHLGSFQFYQVECPYCGQFHVTMLREEVAQALDRDNTGTLYDLAAEAGDIASSPCLCTDCRRLTHEINTLMSAILRANDWLGRPIPASA
jgi:hypothetical protein